MRDPAQRMVAHDDPEGVEHITNNGKEWLMNGTWMIYGANGYTGTLIAREAHKRRLTPVLAGRSADKVQPLADELGFDARVFDVGAAADHLTDIDLVIHCAGPFSATSAPMVEACLSANAHYLDITGEIDVFENSIAQDARAKQAGVVICSGVGFDVIPTDCIAARLAQALPDATELALGFESRSQDSPGTAKTTVEGMATGGRVRRDGKIVSVPMSYKSRAIDFGTGQHIGATIPWGDVSTAYHTTGIGNIEVYLSVPEAQLKLMKRVDSLRPILRLKPVTALLKWLAGRTAGMDEAGRENAPMFVWGEAKNANGDTVTARVKTANGYTVTVHGALAVAERVLADKPDGGSYTPSKLCGADLVEQLPGSGSVEITQ